MAALAGCPAPQRPQPLASALAIEIGRAGASLRAVAGDGERSYAAFTVDDKQTVIEARRGDKVAWSAKLDGTAAALARGGDVLYVATIGNPALRGEPGAVITALDGKSGAVNWSTIIDSTEWALVGTLAASDDGCVAGGSFGGTLRAGETLGAPPAVPNSGSQVVSTAGGSDGFVARLGPRGDVRWVVRMGGAGADAIQGVALAGPRVAIAGTFAAGADLAGQPLAATDERSVTSDGFVAELDASGARKWSTTFGGRADDAVAGVAIDASGRIAVAATAREVVHVDDTELIPQGISDGMLAWWQNGKLGGALLFGGPEFDGASALVASGDRFVIGGFFSGSVRLGDRVLESSGDDAFIAIVDHAGHVASSLQASGAGREELAALSAIPGGFVAGVRHTAAASLDGTQLPAPADPMTGGALVVHGL